MDPEITSQLTFIAIEEEMRSAYIDYAMSVIIARALPDARDGLKPVHRRVLYGMYELGVHHDKPYKKSARIVGEVLGKFHPHSDASVYDTMVRMAQTWSLRYPLVQGQGNFGSVDGDSPAAMRYTEARLARVTQEMLGDLNKETVDLRPNFDESLQEPTVLPAQLPNLLVNGAAGIAVGMATNMPPHNLREVLEGVKAYIANPELTIAELMQHIVAPDFPTGGIIYGYQGIKDAYETGRGRVIMRAQATIEPGSEGREQIIVTEIPYMVNKAMMIEKTAQLINEKKLLDIADIRDESDKEGLRVVYDLKKDAVGSVVLNNLYKQTALQSSFSINNVALLQGKPKLLNLKQLIEAFVDHRHEVVTRRTQYELRQAQRRMHILEGYLVALDHLDAVIALIKAASTPQAAKEGLMQTYQLSDPQAKAILDLKLQRLTGMERDKITTEYQGLKVTIEDLEDILAHRTRRMAIIVEELNALQERYADKRRTVIEHNAEEFTMEDMIPNDPMVITVSNQGYIKRTPLIEYRTQARGGVGARGVSTKQDDFTNNLFVATAHDYLLIFTAQGRVYWKKVYALPEGGKTTQGRAIQNLVAITPGDQVRSILRVSELDDPKNDELSGRHIVFCTQRGTIKKTPLAAFSRPRATGIIAITIHPGDNLLEATLTEGNNHLIMALASGRAIRFHEEEVRTMGRTAAGVRGVSLAHDGDRVVGMVSVPPGAHPNLLVVSDKGYGKQSSLADYRITHRGGKGVKTMQVTDKTGGLVAIKAVTAQDELMIVNKSGITIRMGVDELRVMGRATQGVRLIRLNEGDEIAAVEQIHIDAKLQEEFPQDEDQAPTVMATGVPSQGPK